MEYTVVLDADDEGEAYSAMVPALPGCLSEVATREEAIENIREAILGFIEALQKAGEPVPTEKRPVGLITVAG